jgi:thiol-disulfide isomerase/thioredoxin
MSRSTIIKTIFIGLLLLPGLFLTAAAQTAPDFTLPSTGKSINLQEYRGKVVYLDFWASWCTPCRKSFPWMNALHKRYAKDGLVVLAVNLDENKQEVGRFLDKYPAEFTVAFDPEGKIAELYQLKGMPSSYLIDKQGNIVMSHIGFRHDDAAQLEKHIKNLLTL